ncbi:MAG: ABC transporter permease [Promethearchaeota archaeon]
MEISYGAIFITILVAQAFTDSREAGLLKRINITPLSSSELIGSQSIVNTMISMVQVSRIVMLSFLLGFRPQTSVDGMIILFIAMGFLSVCSVGFGLIIVSVSKNAGTAMGISLFFILPQLFFGTFIPLNNTIRMIGIWIDIAIVSLMGLIIFLIGIQVFKKYGND